MFVDFETLVEYHVKLRSFCHDDLVCTLVPVRTNVCIPSSYPSSELYVIYATLGVVNPLTFLQLTQLS